MMIQILPPDEALKKAKDRVAEWKRQREIDAAKTRIEAMVEAGKAKPEPEKKSVPIKKKGSKLTTDKQKDIDLRFIEAIEKGNTKDAQELLNNGANVDAIDKTVGTALMKAIFHGNPKIAKILIEQGADVNARSHTRYGEDRTVLMTAVERGYTTIAKMLIGKGANVNANDKHGITALMTSAIHRYTDIAKLLIKNGAEIDAKDNQGNTALMKAAEFGITIETAKLLIDKGADVNAKTNNGETPLFFADRSSFPKIVELLKKHGAK